MRKKAYLPPLPIISVGNITLGGTGKTPLVYYLANSLLRYYDRIAILTRGYGKITNSAVGRQLGAKDDEDFTYRFKNIIRIVNRNRVEGVKKAIEERCKLAILDDGFQYHKIRKNIEIVVINPFQKIFSSFIFPFGILREDIEAIKYADFLILNHSRLINKKFKKRLYDKLREYKKPIFNMSYKIAYLINARTGEKVEIEKFANTNVITFCAIGCRDSFLSLLRQSK
ncbi:MAG: tetraacyldisaccharide 4'-kinase, partial [Planctomycetota bacterium]